MKTTPKSKCGHAAHANDHTNVWIDVGADTLAEAERLHAIHSAAPDLLEALERLVEECVNDDNVTFMPSRLAVDAARAAIAKAKGQA